MVVPLKYGLLGWPVKHSVSPQMHGAGFRALGLDATYELVPIEPENFDLRIPQLVAEGFRGWNITIPHKGAMFAHLDQIDPVARQAESVNTVCQRDGRLHGYSTDGYSAKPSRSTSPAVPSFSGEPAVQPARQPRTSPITVLLVLSW